MRAEIWARPGAATFARIWEDPQAIRFSGTARMSATGDGEMQLPDTDATVELADKLLLTDPDTPGNSTRALVRVYADGDVGGTDPPLHEWRVESVVPPTDNSDPTWEVSGLDPFSFLDDAEVKPWDWNGTDDYISLFPDWVWGGRNLLGEIQSVFRPHTMLVWNDATGGTFKIGVSFDGGAYTYTGNIAYNATAAAIDVALNAIGYTTTVTGEGTETNPWRIQFMSPEGAYLIAQDVALLTGGTGYISIEEVGAELPRGWEESKSYISNLNHGTNIEFRLSDGTGGDPALPACDTSGWSIMFNGTEPRFPGIQKPVKVKPGGIYQASVWVYAQGAGADVRLVIRDLFENGIAAEPDFSSGTTLVADTWTQMTITDVQIPSNTADILFRIGHVGTGDPPKIFVACPQFTEGLAVTTIGDIWEQLYDDATTNHAPGRIVWEDESGGLPGDVFLTLGFTDALDSGGNAWDDSEVSLTAKRGFSYGRVMKETLKLGYEARIVPVPATDGQWQLEIYNPGTLGTDYTGDDFVGIRVGREVIRKAVRRFVPTGTQVTVENGNQGFSHAASAAAITSLGRLEYYTPERDLGTLAEAGLAADALLAKALSRGRSIQPVILPGPDDPTPFVDYTIGDIIDLDDPDEGITVSARLAALSYAVADDLITYEPALSAETFVGSAAISQGVRQLLEAQDAIRREPPGESGGIDLFAQEAWSDTNNPGAYIHLARAATQTIAVSGSAIEWDTLGPIAASNFSSLVPTTQAVIQVAGYYNVAIQAGWDTHTAGGSVWVVRIRGGTPTTMWPVPEDPGLWTSTDGQLFEGVAPSIPCIAGDIIKVYIDHDTGSTKDLASATLAVYLVDRAAEATLLGSDYATLVMSDEPIAYWRLGETSGTTAVDQTGTHNATYVNTPTLGQPGVMQDGYGDTAPYFDEALSEYVAGSDWGTLDLTSGSFTIELWFNAEDLTGTAQMLIGKKESAEPWEGWEIWAIAAGVKFFDDGYDDGFTTGVVNSGTLDNDTVYHVVVTSDRTTTRLYINGAEVDVDTGGITITANTEIVAIGRDVAAGGLNWDGYIDEVAIYDRVLESDEIADHYVVGTRG